MNSKTKAQSIRFLKWACAFALLFLARRYLKSVAAGAFLVETLVVILTIAMLITRGFDSSSNGKGFSNSLRKFLFKRIPKPMIQFAEVEWLNLSAFFRKKPTLQDDPYSFSFTQKSTYSQILIGIALILILEGFLVHLFIIPYFFAANQLKAQGVLFLLELYGALWISGDYLNMKYSRHRITSAGISLQQGTRLKAFIPLSSIRKITENSRNESSKWAVGAYPIRCTKRDQPNLLIEFNCAITLNKSFGQDLEVSAIALFLDEPSKMTHAINEKQISKVT